MEDSQYKINVVVPVYNKAQHISRTIQSIAKQQIKSDDRFMITAVNDGSTDNSLELLQQLSKNITNLTIVNLEKNKGRSQARNLGAKAQAADIYIFLDADCSWESANTLQQYLQHFSNNAQACLGITNSTESDFWGRYFFDLAEQRKANIDRFNQATTANFACTQLLFEHSGGFPTQYRHYGFEDRDFLLSLLNHASESSIVFDDTIVASNNDRTTLFGISQKMMGAGQYSAPIFKRRHPIAYSQTAFYKIDIKTKSVLIQRMYRKVDSLVIAANNFLINLFETQHLPYPLKKKLVKLCSALAYLHGTSLSSDKT